MTKLVLFTSGLLALAGCISTGGSGIDLKPMEQAISQGSELSLVLFKAMNAISTSAPVACTQVTQACAAFPCANGTVTVTLSSDCPFVLGGVGSGSVSVMGQWSSATSATLSSTFASVKIGTTESVVASTTSVSVSGDTVTYTGQNVNVNGSSEVSSQSSWTLTQNSPSAGALTIAGSDQAAGGSATGQLTVSDVVLDPSCTKNPVSGTVTIQSVGGLSIQQATVTFHSTCDGKADVGGTQESLTF